jgi:hypothetical protein
MGEILSSGVNKKEEKAFRVKAVLVFLIISAVGFFTVSSCGSSQKEELGTFDDPEIALIETKKVLSALSENLNKGYESVHQIKEYEVTKNKIFTLD